MEIPQKKAMNILLEYEGYNNKILEYKWKLKNVRGFVPSRTQADYINKAYKHKPKVAKKFITLTDSFADNLMKEKLLMQHPKKIWCEKLLFETDKAYHIWGQFTPEGKMDAFWIPKTSIIPDKREFKGELDLKKYDHRPPMEHQVPAIKALLANDKFILADDMGLGKTTSAVIAAMESGAKKVLVICTATLKINWEREIKNYTSRRTLIVEGGKWGSTFDFYIINYDILKNYHTTKKDGISLIERENFDLVIIDEAHTLSNNSTIRTKLTMDIAKTIPKVWLLTGTPMTSRPINYYNLLKLVDSPVTNNWQHFVKRYCNGFQFTINRGTAAEKKIWSTKGSTNLDELKEVTNNKIMRRLKTDKLNLPPKIIAEIPLELTNMYLYDSELREFMEITKEKRKKETLTVTLSRLMAIRQLIANEKVQYTTEIIDKYIENDKKVIVFTNFTSIVDELAEKYKSKAVVVDGRMNKNQRQRSVDAFQENPKVKLFIGNIVAAGTGLNLTAAECVIMNDLSFVPAHHSQAEDRAYRIGQDKSVNIYYPVFENTIEVKIYDILKNKKDVINQVMGDDEEEQESVRKELLQNILDFSSSTIDINF